jgi:predicted permease
MNIDTGFDRENVVVFDLNRSVDLGRLEQLFKRLEGLPGIQSATTWDTGMLGQGITMVGPVRVDGHVPRPGEDLWAFATSVGPRFFETVGVSLLAGRDFRPEDAGRRVAVINETMAKFFFGSQNPIGRSYNSSGDPKRDTEIIGIAEDTKYASLTGVPPRVTYLPLSLNARNGRSAKFAVRISSSPAAVANAVTTAVKELDPGLQVMSVHTLQETVLGKLIQPRFIAHLASLFSVLALFLACVGLYGTLSNAVMQRTNEIGIRMALGARAVDVLTMLMRETGWILAGGLLAGFMGSALAGQAISGLLFGLAPTDPSTFAAAALLLIAAAAVAAYVPARRASRVDPVIALRHD